MAGLEIWRETPQCKASKETEFWDPPSTIDALIPKELPLASREKLYGLFAGGIDDDEMREALTVLSASGTYTHTPESHVLAAVVRNHALNHGLSRAITCLDADAAKRLLEVGFLYGGAAVVVLSLTASQQTVLKGLVSPGHRSWIEYTVANGKS